MDRLLNHRNPLREVGKQHFASDADKLCGSAAFFVFLVLSKRAGFFQEQGCLLHLSHHLVLHFRPSPPPARPPRPPPAPPSPPPPPGYSLFYSREASISAIRTLLEMPGSRLLLGKGHRLSVRRKLN
eukprot:jgi/Botrbrau1/5158/Bobra.0172s0030.1